MTDSGLLPGRKRLPGWLPGGDAHSTCVRARISSRAGGAARRSRGGTPEQAVRPYSMMEPGATVAEASAEATVAEASAEAAHRRASRYQVSGSVGWLGVRVRVPCSVRSVRAGTRQPAAADARI